MAPDQQLFDQLFRDQINQARRMSPEERVRVGLHLSDLAFRVMADSIRQQSPEASDDEVQRLVRERVRRIRRLKEIR
jgi:hypothetical protein